LRFPFTNKQTGRPNLKLLDSLTDNALMMQVKNGDLDKLGLLFERYNRILFAFFYRLGNDSEVCEDLIQNVFMRIVKYKKNFKGEGQFKHWIFHIARNIHADNYRVNNKLGKRESLENYSDRLTDHGELVTKDEVDDNVSLLKKCISMMDEEKRELITLSKLEGMKYKDIGTIINCSEGTVKVKIFRALKELKDIFQKTKLNHG